MTYARENAKKSTLQLDFVHFSINHSLFQYVKDQFRRCSSAGGH